MDENLKAALILLIVFPLFWLALWFALPLLPPLFFWPSLLALSIAWFVYEINLNKTDKGRVVKVTLTAAALVAATIVVNYNGALADLYFISPEHTFYLLLGSPIELLLLAFFGGAALFLFLPRRLALWQAALYIVALSLFGTATEFMLNAYGIMEYVAVGYLDAFFTYALVWAALFSINYFDLKRLTKLKGLCIFHSKF